VPNKGKVRQPFKRFARRVLLRRWGGGVLPEKILWTLLREKEQGGELNREDSEGKRILLGLKRDI